MFKKIVLFIALALGAGVVFWYKTHDQSIKVPVWGEDSMVVVSTLLEKNNLTNFPVKLQSDAIVASVSGYTVLFPKNGDYPKLVQALQTILTAVTMDTDTKVIDLRFEKPVLRN